MLAEILWFRNKALSNRLERKMCTSSYLAAATLPISKTTKRVEERGCQHRTATLRHNDVRRRKQYGHRRDYREQREDDKAQSVDYHRGEFPIARYVVALVLLAKLIGYNAQFLKD